MRPRANAGAGRQSDGLGLGGIRVDHVRQAAETVSNLNLQSFFERYVAGTETIPWNDLLRGVGLQITRTMTDTSDPGFEASRMFDMPAVVISVQPGSAAETAGLQEGDSILSINGEPAGADFDSRLATVAAGNEVRLQVKNASGTREVKFTAGTRQVLQVEIKQFEIVAVEQAGTCARFRAHVASGTYMRSVAQEMGQLAGCGAHLQSLRRTAVAEFHIEDAHTLEQLEQAARSQDGNNAVADFLVHPRKLLPAIPAVTATDEMVSRIRHGRPDRTALR